MSSRSARTMAILLAVVAALVYVGYIVWIGVKF
jgi:hypothetical protein